MIVLIYIKLIISNNQYRQLKNEEKNFRKYKLKILIRNSIRKHKFKKKSSKIDFFDQVK